MVEAEGKTYYYNGNSFFGANNATLPALCLYFRTLGQVEVFHDYNDECWLSDGPTSRDRDVLVALYNATDGPNWLRSENWLSNRPISEWTGVWAVGAPSERRVTELDLSAIGMTGEIPPELGQLDHLARLKLESNQLRGEIPPELGQLEQLGRLDLSDNQLTGEIPPQLGQFDQLTFLDLTVNRLTGNVPTELGGLPALRVLVLAGNPLHGCIPAPLEGQILDGYTDDPEVYLRIRGLPFCER